MSKIILTGDRPTGRLHVGHYVGSLAERVKLQNSGLYDEIYIMIADAQRSVGHAGMIDVCPIAKIACGRFGFHDDKLARITLCVVEGVAHRIRGRIGRTVDDRVAAVALTLYAVGVVAPDRKSTRLNSSHPSSSRMPSSA